MPKVKKRVRGASKSENGILSRRHRDLPATVGLVQEVRDELKAEIQGVRDELKAEIQGVRGELKAEIQQVLVSVHRTQALMEEQRGENRIVLDGLKNVIERQDRLENVILEQRGV